jgi:hypothetical protein
MLATGQISQPSKNGDGLYMPRDGAIIFADLIGKLDVLYVHCPKCSRASRYQVRHVIGERRRNQPSSGPTHIKIASKIKVEAIAM